MITRSDINKYLDQQLGQSKFTNQGTKYCCPICDHGMKFNLEINLNPTSSKYLLYHCWSCHLKGHLKNLLKKYSETDSWKSHSELWEIKIYENIDLRLREEKKFPKKICSYFNSKSILDYLLNVRNLPENLLKNKNISYCYSEEEELFNKIIFPFFEDKENIGFSTQDFKTKKYCNYRGLNFVAYKEFINTNFPIIVTEGIYDSLSVPNAIPILGTTPSNELYKFSKDKKIILCLDNEVPLEDKKTIADKFMMYDAHTVVIFDLKEYKDLNEYRVNDPINLQLEMKELFLKLI